MPGIIPFPPRPVPFMRLAMHTPVLMAFALLLMFLSSALGQPCSSSSDTSPGCWRPVHEAPGFHDKANHVSVEHSVHVNPFGGQLTVAAVDVNLPGLMQGFGLRVRRVHNSSRLLVPLPVPSPDIHDGPLWGGPSIMACSGHQARRLPPRSAGHS
jgi:hypothetical protein